MFARLIIFFVCAMALNANADNRLADLVLTDLDGNQIKLSETTGQLRVINFWATWCPPCVKEMPSLSRLDQALQSSNAEVITINVGEDNTTVNAFVMENLPSTNMGIFLDTAGNSFKAFELKGLPITLIVDADDKIIDRILGEREWDSQETIDKLTQLSSNN